jgi:hypothetical protein
MRGSPPPPSQHGDEPAWWQSAELNPIVVARNLWGHICGRHAGVARPLGHHLWTAASHPRAPTSRGRRASPWRCPSNRIGNLRPGIYQRRVVRVELTNERLCWRWKPLLEAGSVLLVPGTVAWVSGDLPRAAPPWPWAEPGDEAILRTPTPRWMWHTASATRQRLVASPCCYGRPRHQRPHGKNRADHGRAAAHDWRTLSLRRQRCAVRALRSIHQADHGRASGQGWTSCGPRYRGPRPILRASATLTRHRAC